MICALIEVHASGGQWSPQFPTPTNYLASGHSPGYVDDVPNSQSGYTDSKISFDWPRLVFDPQRLRADGKPRLLICDGSSTLESLEILISCFGNDYLVRIPSHTSHKLQRCDVRPFGPLKAV